MAQEHEVSVGPHPSVIARVGGPIDETRVTLSLHGDDLDPDHVTGLLKCHPSRSHRRGEPRPRGAKPWPHGAWLLTVEGKTPTDPDLLVNRLLNALPEDPNLWSALRNRFTIRMGLGLFLDAWNRGFELSAETVARVSRTAGSLGFDIYCEAADDEEPAALSADG
jgi:hypothetical protein